MTATKPKNLGDMNGWTPMLFRIQLMATPLVVAAVLTLGTWLVKSVNQLGQTQAVMSEKLDAAVLRNYSRDSARADHLELRRSILGEVAERYPPAYLLKTVGVMEKRLDRLESP